MSETRQRKKAKATNAEEAVEKKESEQQPQQPQPQQQEQPKKKSIDWLNVVIRTLSCTVMLSMFAGFVYLGHWACFGIVVFCQIAMFRELQNVREKGVETEIKLINRISNWSFFVSFCWGVTGRVLVITFGEQWLKLGMFGTILVKYHSLVTFCLYCIAFAAFVLSLSSGHLKERFKSFAWTHMILLVVMLQVNLWEHTVFKGLFWFVLPSILVAANDLFAFCFGKLFGKHSLISVSPNKTWEGFIGALFSTIIFGFFFTRPLSTSTWLICPKTDLFSWGVVCEPNPVFDLKLYTAPSWFFGGFSFYARPVQFHSLVFVLFASLVAPFGGFFASGLKRAFGVKDFDHVIPGHGGITDRMDCEFLMGTFVNLYYTTFIAPTSIDSVMNKIITLTPDAQLEVLNRLAALHNMTLSH